MDEDFWQKKYRGPHKKEKRERAKKNLNFSGKNNNFTNKRDFLFLKSFSIQRLSEIKFCFLYFILHFLRSNEKIVTNLLRECIKLFFGTIDNYAIKTVLT